MLSLNEWLARVSTERAGIVADVQALCNVAIYPHQDRDGNLTGTIGIQVNLPAGDQKRYRLYGFLESAQPGDATLDTIADLIQSAFGVTADAAIWQLEDLR